MGQKKIKTIDLSIDADAKDAKTKDTKIAKKKDAKTIDAKDAKDAKTKDTKIAKTIDAKKERPKKVHSRRYRILKTKIDRKKFYPIKKAIKLLLKISNSKIDETVEIHISTHVNKLTGILKLPHVMGKTQKKELKFKTERKFPLLHIIIGKISLGEKKLLENLESLVEKIEMKNIKKATLTSTHSPGIKLVIDKK